MKKLSKRLLAMLLVAVMVMAAIPFGAFADTHTEAEHDDSTNAVWTALSSQGDNDGHILKCAICGKAKSTSDAHTYNANGICKVCNYEHVHSFTGATTSGDAAGHKIACAGCPVKKNVPHTDGERFTKIDAVSATCTLSGNKEGKRYDCGYQEGGETIAALGHNYVNGKCTRCGDTSHACSTYKDGKCTVCGKEHVHTGWALVADSGKGSAAGHKEKCNGCDFTRIVPHTGEHFVETAKVPATCTAAGTEAKKTYDCGYVEGGAVIAKLEHTDANKDGICDVCKTGVPLPPVESKKKYSLTVIYGTTTASGHEAEFTEAQLAATFGTASALRSYLSGLGGDYATIASKMADADYTSNKAVVNSLTGTISIDMRSAGGNSGSSDPTSDYITVYYDDGNTRTINRVNNVGTWYFASSNLGLSNTWGTKQAILKIKDANGFRYVTWGSKDADAYIKATDSEVWVLGNNKTVTIYYLKSSTSNPTTTNAHATKKYEFNTQLGTLPDLPAGYNAWYVDGVLLTENTVYDWESDYVYAYPGKGDGDGRVHLFIYNNNKELLKNVDVTDNVQSNGLITRTGLVKTIEYQTGRKNLTLAGLFTESGWAYYLNNDKSTRYAQSEISVGVAGERQGTQNIYVVLTNVSGGSNADSSNPKTGDTAMIGTAAIVMALAVVGMGTAFYMKKKELF